MELGGEHIVFADDTGKFVRIFAGSKDGFGVFGSEVVTVDKVKARFLSDVFKQRVRAGLVYCVSAHVRHFQTTSVFIGLIGGKAFDPAFKAMKSFKTVSISYLYRKSNLDFEPSLFHCSL